MDCFHATRIPSMAGLYHAYAGDDSRGMEKTLKTVEEIVAWLEQDGTAKFAAAMKPQHEVERLILTAQSCYAGELVKWIRDENN